jgi:serpin B
MYKSLIATALSVALTACSNSESDGFENVEGSVFDDSILVERYGNVQSRELEPVTSDNDIEVLIAGYNQFSLDTYKAQVDTEPQENVIVSGYSLATALILTMSGTAGASREALAALLHLDTLTVDSVDATANAVDLMLDARNNESLQLRSANRLFVTDNRDYSFHTPFLDNAVANYGAPITTADFINQGPQVVEKINAWVRNETNGLIEKLLERIDPETLIAILNATLLDATWETTFQDTGDREFTTLAGESVVAPFFGNQQSYLTYVDDVLTAIDLPYAGGELSMLIVMPEELAALEQSLSSESIAEIVDQLREQRLNLNVPEWSFEQSIDAKTLLLPLGLPSGPMDFSRMLEGAQERIEITGVVQKARIEVDKDGTRAAAATAVTVGVTSVPEELINVTIDKPFWYAIRDRESGLLLFSGRVLNPLDD